jgi:NCS1 nucleoside transporter family
LGLSVRIAAIVTGSILGSFCTAYTGTLGPRTGLRQIAISRFSFGFWGAKLCSVLNIIIGIGFSVINVVITGQLLSAASDYRMTISVGSIITSIISYLVSLFGFSLIHTFEKYSWIVALLFLCILLGQTGHEIGATAPSLSGLILAGAWLSFLSISFSNAAAWCALTSDYYCNYPNTTKSWKIFSLTSIGVTLPSIFIATVGACISNAAINDGNASYTAAFKDHGIGGLVRQIYHPHGFSIFCLNMLTFSVLGNNIAILYSCGLSFQLLGNYFHAVPRLTWSLILATIVAVCSIIGKNSLSQIVSNFVSLLGYWSISFTLILLIEDKYFRKTEGYSLEGWDQPSALPWGLAAVVSLLAGYLAGGVTGMAQVWYVGPIAAYNGPYGGDVGVFLSGAITTVC